jgi:two-component system nitrate/nitrite sensor histidine kinase NarX
MTANPTLSVPLRHGDGSLGELVVMRRGDQPFVPADARLLASIAEACAAAVADARARIEEQDRAVLEERQRIARELHDSLAQVLAVTHLRLRVLGGRSEVVELGPLRAEVDQIADVCQEGYRDVREAILGLHDRGDGQRAFLESLREYMDKYSDQSGIRAVLDADFADGLVLAPHTELHMVRVIQEALTNVRKHSGARTVEVRVAQEPSTTLVVIEDDGQGFDVAGAEVRSGGFGLSSMRERLALLGGSLTVKSAPGSGSCVIAQLPRGSQHHAAVLKVSDERDRPSDPHPAG